EYLYAFLGTKDDDALIIFKVEDIQRAKAAFEKQGIRFLEEKKLYEL
ncbi:MAG TPA: amino acid-binding protein, partial [Syntrophomonas sp.]|nr:amino acid-binding protein [Syntrophomonas sp.]